MPAKNDHERAIESATGLSVDYMRDTPLDEQWKDLEKRTGKPLTVGSDQDAIPHSADINKEVDKMLK